MSIEENLSPEAQHVHDYCGKMMEIHEDRKKSYFKVRDMKNFQYNKGLEMAYRDIQHFLWEMTSEHRVDKI